MTVCRPVMTSTSAMPAFDGGPSSGPVMFIRLATDCTWKSYPARSRPVELPNPEIEQCTSEGLRAITPA